MCSFEGIMILDSSMVEHTAVNRGVVGSSPTRGVFIKYINYFSIFEYEVHTCGLFFYGKKGCKVTLDMLKYLMLETNFMTYGSLVKRLRHRPFTAVTRVRFP